MLGDITIGQMYPANSVVHRLDPRFKIIFTIIFVVMLFMSGSAALALNVAFVIFAYLISKIPLKMLLKTVKPIIPVVIFMTVFNLFFYSGETLLTPEGFFIKIYLEGVYMALFMSVRILCIIAGTSVLTYTTSSIELTDAIESLLSPLKIVKFPVHELAMMMTIALRFIPTLIEETQKIMSAQKARGADFESGNLISRVKALMPILIPLFVSAIKRANELATAMESRCYHNGIGRTRLKTLKSGPRDYVALAVMALALAAVVVLGIYFPSIY